MSSNSRKPSSDPRETQDWSSHPNYTTQVGQDPNRPYFVSVGEMETYMKSMQEMMDEGVPQDEAIRIIDLAICQKLKIDPNGQGNDFLRFSSSGASRRASSQNNSGAHTASTDNSSKSSSRGTSSNHDSYSSSYRPSSGPSYNSYHTYSYRTSQPSFSFPSGGQSSSYSQSRDRSTRESSIQELMGQGYSRRGAEYIIQRDEDWQNRRQESTRSHPSHFTSGSSYRTYGGPRSQSYPNTSHYGSRSSERDQLYDELLREGFSSYEAHRIVSQMQDHVRHGASSRRRTPYPARWESYDDIDDGYGETTFGFRRGRD